MSNGDAQIHSRKVCPSRCCLVIAGHSWASPWTVPCQMSPQLSILIKRSLCEVVRLSYLTTYERRWQSISSLKCPLQAMWTIPEPGRFFGTCGLHLPQNLFGNDFNGNVSGDLGHSCVMVRALQVSTGYAQSVRVVISPTLSIASCATASKSSGAEQGWHGGLQSKPEICWPDIWSWKSGSWESSQPSL